MPVAKKETDFLKTLERMYKDSRILYDKGEYYNCCYLCGYILECALKYILLKFGRKENGEQYAPQDMKSHRHNTASLNRQLEECISMSGGINPCYRIESERNCPYMYVGKEGYPHWNPEYRYGEHPKWDEKEYCQHYMKESEFIFQFISNIVVGGAI